MHWRHSRHAAPRGSHLTPLGRLVAAAAVAGAILAVLVAGGATPW